MRWCVMRHADAGLAVVAEISLPIHRSAGWVRISPYATEQRTLRLADFAEVFDDLDPAPEAAPPDVAEPDTSTAPSADAKPKGK